MLSTTCSTSALYCNSRSTTCWFPVITACSSGVVCSPRCGDELVYTRGENKIKINKAHNPQLRCRSYLVHDNSGKHYRRRIYRPAYCQSSERRPLDLRRPRPPAPPVGRLHRRDVECRPISRYVSAVFTRSSRLQYRPVLLADPLPFDLIDHWSRTE